MNKAKALAVVMGAGLIAGAAACGSSSSGTAPNGVKTLSPSDILSKSAQALKDGRSVRITGDIADSSGKFTLDLSADTSANCSGTIGAASQGTFKIIKIGDKVWIKPDASFWQSHGGAAAQQLVGDRYLQTSASNPDFTSLASLCDLNKLADEFTQGATNLSAGAQTTLGGTPVIPVHGTGTGGEQGTIYIAATGKPYPLRLERGAGSTLDFKDFGAPVPATAPPASQSIDLDQLGKLDQQGGTPSPTTSTS
jgi:hypothetical protein